MGFSSKQLQALQRDVNARYVRKKEVNGRELTYIEGWYAISEANRIFGFDGWSRETVESRCVLARENRGAFIAVYVAKVRISVQAETATVVREGHGTGEGRGSSPGEVHEMAIKAAETDATKRALATFGRPFGLALYAGSKSGIDKLDQTSGHAKRGGARPVTLESTDAGRHVALPPDNTTPIPRPSRYYGREQYLRMRDRGLKPVAGSSSKKSQVSTAETSLAPSEPLPFPSRIDKSLLPIGEPKRLRDKAHLKFVASQPCLICGRQPSDPHHLRFAQPRALGLKVSDEFTVPLCRGHHRQLHQAGNEAAWWEDLDINALEIAKGLWEESHGRSTDIIRSDGIGNQSAQETET